ncbi:MAG: hypothetical protein K8U57_32090 [Planctomycetes bacterium]|nr:hypothetical protein [Planctomycetota bacterium]
MAEPSNSAWPNEAEYNRYLANERRLFAWCIVRFGNHTSEEAERKALDRYPYEGPTEPHRGLVFHNLSWDWAMTELFGDCYWVHRPDLAGQLEQWRLEFEREAGMRE